MPRKAVEIAGKSFGKLTAIKPSRKKRHAWIFSCECGSRCVKLKSHVVTGRTTSCGCLRKAIDTSLVGTKHHRLTILKVYLDRGRLMCDVRCDCGTRKSILKQQLYRNTVSCGCYASESVKSRMTKHGLTSGDRKTRLAYIRVISMNERCYNKKDRAYDDYGRRGITVCRRWRVKAVGVEDAVKNFIDDMGYPTSKDMSIDRSNNDKGYYPANCKWATKSEQANNRRSSRHNLG